MGYQWTLSDATLAIGYSQSMGFQLAELDASDSFPSLYPYVVRGS